MNQIKVYDAPTRLFHIIFSFGFLAAFSIGKYVDDEKTLYGLHMIIGLTLGFTLVWRLIWGFIGGRYSRWKNFNLSLKALLDYFINLKNRKKSVATAHNPASSWSALIMMLFAAAMVASGVSMVTGVGGEFAEELHEIGSTLWIILAVAHTAGALFQHWSLKDNTAFTMYSGKRSFNDSRIGESKMSYGWAITFLILTSAFFFTLFYSYNLKTGELSLLNRSWQLTDTTH